MGNGDPDRFPEVRDEPWKEQRVTDRIIARVVRVEGMVTGVGFRYSTLRRAAPYMDLRGHVRNVDSRTVECVLQGREQDVEEMIAWLRQGPPSARVLTCHVAEIPVAPSRPLFGVA